MIALLPLISALQLALAQDSVYIGQIKYSLAPHQPFEHQFFKIDAVNSMDLYFPEPPYKVVNDTDLNCYWSFQEVGIKEIANWPAAGERSQGDLLCVGLCYLTHHDTLYILSQKQMTGKKVDQTIMYPSVLDSVELPAHLVNAQFIDLSSRGYLILYTSKYAELWDIGRGTHVKKIKTDSLISKVS